MGGGNFFSVTNSKAIMQFYVCEHRPNLTYYTHDQEGLRFFGNLQDVQYKNGMTIIIKPTCLL